MLKTGWVNNTDSDSPLTKPVYVAVSVGLLIPWNLVLSSALIDNAALFTIKILFFEADGWIPSEDWEAVIIAVPTPTICIVPVEDIVTAPDEPVEIDMFDPAMR